MSKVTIDQLCECADLIKRGHVTSEAFQEFLQIHSRMGFSQIYKRAIDLALQHSSTGKLCRLEKEVTTKVISLLLDAGDHVRAEDLAKKIMDDGQWGQEVKALFARFFARLCANAQAKSLMNKVTDPVLKAIYSLDIARITQDPDDKEKAIEAAYSPLLSHSWKANSLVELASLTKDKRHLHEAQLEASYCPWDSRIMVRITKAYVEFGDFEEASLVAEGIGGLNAYIKTLARLELVKQKPELFEEAVKGSYGICDREREIEIQLAFYKISKSEEYLLVAKSLLSSMMPFPKAFSMITIAETTGRKGDFMEAFMSVRKILNSFHGTLICKLLIRITGLSKTPKDLIMALDYAVRGPEDKEQPMQMIEVARTARELMK